MFVKWHPRLSLPHLSQRWQSAPQQKQSCHSTDSIQPILCLFPLVQLTCDLLHKLYRLHARRTTIPYRIVMRLVAEVGNGNIGISFCSRNTAVCGKPTSADLGGGCAAGAGSSVVVSPSASHLSSCRSPCFDRSVRRRGLPGVLYSDKLGLESSRSKITGRALFHPLPITKWFVENLGWNLWFPARAVK